jgi:hemerythrin
MITWNTSLETGNAVVDRDHQALINQINALEDALKMDATREELGPMIVFLNQYAREHFVREEGIMRTVQCPASGQNCTAHRALIGKLNTWVARLKAGGATTSLGVDVYREMGDWLQEHIVKVDCQLRTCQPG